MIVLLLAAALLVWAGMLLERARHEALRVDEDDERR